MSLPIIRRLPDHFSIVDAFAALRSRPGCLWLDSSSRGPVSTKSLDDLGRFSFLTCDPIETLEAFVDGTDPWPELERWCEHLPPDSDPTLPPFQGGIAGLIGYEAAAWLEPVGLASANDLPTPAMSLGLYDWTIAVDHHSGESYLISQGLGVGDPSHRIRRAEDRADQVESWLASGSPHESAGCVASPASSERRLHPTGTIPTSFEGVLSNFSSEAFQGSVADVVRRIHAGDSFQVNLAQRLLKPSTMPPEQTYLRLRAANPAPFSAYYAGNGFHVLSSSPEGFLKVRDRVVETRPIKGTTARVGEQQQDLRLADELFASPKDRAENIMIVDLMRNDLSRVCEDDSVVAEQLCEVESYQHVQHLVSVVQGRLREQAGVVDLLRACFPGGSVTGAPKIEAMRTIAALEPHHRGPYCGSIGYISCGGSADFNILIRTITQAHGYWQIPVGGGITARSQPQAEEAETWTKAEGMLQAVR